MRKRDSDWTTGVSGLEVYSHESKYGKLPELQGISRITRRMQMIHKSFMGQLM